MLYGHDYIPNISGITANDEYRSGSDLKLDAIRGALESVWTSVVSTGDLVPVDWKREGIILRNLTFVDMLQPAARNSNAVSRAASLVSHLRPIYEAMRAISSTFEYEYESAIHCLQTLRPMCGLASLPSDVMLFIFELAVEPDCQDEHQHSCRAWNTLRLSHVCRHFRNIILSFPQLWNKINIHPDNSGPLTKACIRYSRETPLDIHLTVFRDTPEHHEYFHAFYQVLIQAHRWRKLTIHAFRLRASKTTRMSLLEQLSWHALGGERVIIGNSRLVSVYKARVSFPSLERLCVEKDVEVPWPFVEILAGRFWWDTPKLKALSVSHYFPSTLPAIPSITILEFTIGRDKFPYAHFLGALQYMSALEDLRIHFENADEERTGEDIAFGQIILASVSSFKLCLETHHLFKPDGRSSQRAFYASLILPNAMNLHFQFLGLYSAHDKQTTSLIEDYLRFADQQFPRVSSFRVDFRVRKYFIGVTDRVVSPALPLHYLRRLDTLVIQCRVPLHIRTYVDVPVDLPLPALRNVTLIVGKGEFAVYGARTRARTSNDVRAWLADYVDGLRSQGDWERFEELTVREVEFSGDEHPVELHAVENKVSRDDVLAWCLSGCEDQRLS